MRGDAVAGLVIGERATPKTLRRWSGEPLFRPEHSGTQPSSRYSAKAREAYGGRPASYDRVSLRVARDIGELAQQWSGVGRVDLTNAVGPTQFAMIACLC